jgi:hypothetical protein
MSDQKLFDAGREISIRIPGPSGMKTAVVRFPTDQEWADRAAAQKLVIRQLGRDQTTTEPIGAEAKDLDLFQAIRIDQDGAVFDQYEASLVISRISRSEAGEPIMDGATYRIPLTVPGAQTEHVLRVPTVAQVAQYRRASATAVTTRRGMSEIRTRLQPAGDLYDDLFVSVSGYAGAVPLIHKSAVLSELLREIDSLIDGDGSGF